MTVGDLAAVRAFIAEQLPAHRLQRQPSWFEWQYVANPDGFDARICIEGSRVVAMSGFIPCRFESEGGILTGAFSTNTLVHPDYRRRGLGRELHKTRLRDYDYALSSGQSDANLRLYRQLGFVTCGRYRRLFAQTTAPSPRPNARFLRQLWSWGRWLAKGSDRDSELRVRIDPHAPRVPDACYRERFGDQAIGPVWNHGHVVWRYERHPYFDYIFATVFRAGDAIGFAVIRRTATSVVLADVYARHCDMVGLLRAVGREFQGVISGLFVGSALRDVFRRAGWVSLPAKNLLLAKSKDLVCDARLRRHSWCFFGGDSDSDR